jgi:hypothetical protein
MVSVSVVLTVYKRNYLEQQLIALSKQTLQPDKIYVFQNGDYVDISEIRKKYNFNYIYNQENTKFYGRFAYCLTLETEYVVIFDDDLIPAPRWLELSISESLRLNAIIGSNARTFKDNKIIAPCNDEGIRPETLLADWVGHCWVFKKKWLHYMFSVEPLTYNGGEDLQLCSLSKLLGNINTYVCKQPSEDFLSDVTFNQIAGDEHASYKIYDFDENALKMKTFFNKMGLKYLYD